MALTYRLVKGHPLTFQEGDDNLRQLSGSIHSLEAATGSYLYSGSLSGSSTLTLYSENTNYNIDLSILSGVLGTTYTNITPTPIDFPNGDTPSIPSGSTFISKSFTEMMNLMLYPTLDPTLTPPSSTFTISPSGFQEISASLNISLNSTFNSGSINPAYGTTGYRSGNANEYIYTGAGTSNNLSTALTDSQTVSPYRVLQGIQSWTGKVAYDAGPQPLDSDGGIFDIPWPVGSTSPITQTITGVYPVFATTSNISILTKQSLQSMSTYIEVSMVAEPNNSDKQEIDIPVAWSNITGLQQFNTLSGKWDNIPLTTFTTTPTTQTVQGASVAYTKYTHNGAKIGARQLRFIV